MIDFKLRYPGFKLKAVTFSYDDGVVQDQKLIEIFDRYHIKGTFNLNCGQSGKGKMRQDKDGNEIDCGHLDLKKMSALYQNHEIANHTYSHPHLEETPKEEQFLEFKKNKEELERIFHKPIFGAAYPYGSWNYDTLLVQKELGVEYNRTIRSSYSFALPHNWLFWDPTIHHRDTKLFDYLEAFYQCDQELALFYIWGHAYEFAQDQNFDMMEKLCRSLSLREDVISMTNHEIYQYVNAASMIYHRFGTFHNDSDVDVYINVDGKNILVPAKGEVPYDSK